MESWFFSIFVIFDFHGPTLGHVLGHVVAKCQTLGMNLNLHEQPGLLGQRKDVINLWTHGENWPQRLDLFWTISNLFFDLRVYEVWHFKGTVCMVILRCCKPRSGKKCTSYVTFKHQRILNRQLYQFFRGLKRRQF